MNLEHGSSHELVEEIQEKLRERDYDPGAINGVYDEETRTAVLAFQAEHGLPEDGTVDEEMLEALDISAELPAPEFERAAFRSLLAGNPNYFGNLIDVPYEPVEELVAETSYEEVVCLGYNPPAERLDAVVHLKREYGYLGNVCSEGSTEYIRFYIDWENDGTWEDLGLASTDVYDIPGEKPLEYALSITLDPEEEPCSVEQLPTVRAVLSWNQPPPAETPGYNPVWGNVLDSRIQIAPTDAPALGDLFDEYEIDPELLPAIDFDQPIALSSPSASVPQLLSSYDDTDVPEHRTTFTQIQSLIHGPSIIDDPELSVEPSLLEELDLDIGDLIDDLNETATNTTYEELTCLGLEESRLSGVVTIKRPTGYLGGLCTEGSIEYVAFWEWREDTSTWEYLGTTGIAVHDIDALPSQGLRYSVSLPVDLSHRQQPCNEGASTVRIRATASWQTPPPTDDPFWTPNWGNHMETRVHVPPGPAIEEGEQIPSIHYVGNMNVCDINQSTGLASGVGRGVSGDQSPFGGRVYISGFITNPPEVMEGDDPVKYRVSVRPHEPSLTDAENPWQPLTDPFTVRATEQNDPTTLPTTNIRIRQTPDDEGFYDYLVDRTGDKWRNIDWPADDILAVWDTGEKNGRWEIKIEAKDPKDGTIVPAGAIACSGGGQRRKVIVELDNSGPTAGIEITGYERDGGDVVPAEECETFFVGDVIHGTYEGSDVNYDDVGYFGHLRFRVRPSGPANGAQVDPVRRSHTEASVPDTGIESGEWQLATEWVDGGTTKRMDPCGYIIENDVRDRTIVHSDHQGWHDEEAVGFCLEDEGVATDGGPLTLATLHVDAEADDYESLNDEYIEFENAGDESLDLSGWIVRDEVNHTYAFPKGFTLEPGASVRLRSGTGEDTESELFWNSESPVWNNQGDTVFVYDADGDLVLKESY